MGKPKILVIDDTPGSGTLTEEKFLAVVKALSEAYGIMADGVFYTGIPVREKCERLDEDVS